MNTPFGVDQCLTFINCQLQPPAGHLADVGQKRAVTISRQSGCGAHVIAETLAGYFQSQAPPEAMPWTVFDRNLVEKVLADHQLPARLARFMPEDRVGEMDNIMDELLGLHPPSWTLVQQTSETILRLLEHGNVIVVGRGANIIGATVPHALHVRLVGSFERRAECKARAEGIDLKEAANRVRQEDLARERYFRKHFNKDINNPLLYHLVINTDMIPCDAAVRLIADLLLQRA